MFGTLFDTLTDLTIEAVRTTATLPGRAVDGVEEGFDRAGKALDDAV